MQVRDLMSPGTREVTVREDARGQVQVAGAEEREAASYSALMSLFAQGVINRTTGATNVNAMSSRSHAIFSIQLEQRVSDVSTGQSRVFSSRLHLVDLAGSERNKKTGAQGKRFKESININQVCLAVGQGEIERRAMLRACPLMLLLPLVVVVGLG